MIAPCRKDFWSKSVNQSPVSNSYQLFIFPVHLCLHTVYSHFRDVFLNYQYVFACIELTALSKSINFSFFNFSFWCQIRLIGLFVTYLRTHARKLFKSRAIYIHMRLTQFTLYLIFWFHFCEFCLSCDFSAAFRDKLRCSFIAYYKNLRFLISWLDFFRFWYFGSLSKIISIFRRFRFFKRWLLWKRAVLLIFLSPIVGGQSVQG